MEALQNLQMFISFYIRNRQWRSCWIERFFKMFLTDENLIRNNLRNYNNIVLDFALWKCHKIVAYFWIFSDAFFNSVHICRNQYAFDICSGIILCTIYL